MTFEEYIKNPMGNKTSVMSNREMYRAMYMAKYNKVMLRENNKIDYTIYKNKNDYYFHFLIPSEVINNFYYDVVVRFMPTKVSGLSTKLDNYNVQFYSNDPRFVFVFAHAFMKEDLFIEDLSPRMSKLAIKNKPKETNPNEDIAYVKSLYFAYLTMKDKGLFNKLIIDPKAISYNKNGLLAKITPADEKIEARQAAQNTLDANKKKEKNNNKEDIKKDIKHLGDEAINTNSNTIRKIGKITGKSGIGKIGSLKNSIGRVNSINKIGKK